MRNTKRNRLAHLTNTLCNLGFALGEVETLLSVERGLQRWHELECGTGDDKMSVSVEREESFALCTQCGHRFYGHAAEEENCPSCGDCAPIRKKATGKPMRRVQYRGRDGKWVDRKTPCRDMEKANLRRLSRVMEGKSVRAYVQGDPRGCALYILRPGDVPQGGDPNAYYSRGIPVCIN
jgi:hypothetical protein